MINSGVVAAIHVAGVCGDPYVYIKEKQFKEK